MQAFIPLNEGSSRAYIKGLTNKKGEAKRTNCVTVPRKGLKFGASKIEFYDSKENREFLKKNYPRASFTEEK